MLQAQTSETRLCRCCGSPLALDNLTLYCSPCRSTRRDYHPAHDPTLRRRLFEVLVRTRLTGRPVNVYRELGIEHCGEEAWICVKGHVRWLRRRGCLIEGFRDGTYRYLGRSDSRGRSRARHHGAVSESGLKIEWWPRERPIPYARNPRLVPDVAIAKVAASLKEFGWRQPIVVDSEGVIVAGHTRLLAAQRLGMGQVPVAVASDLTPAQVKAYRLTDNRSAQETSWDEELLEIELEELSDLDIDLALTGFDDDELAAFLAAGTEGLTDPDFAPEPPESPVSRPGDLWLLGRHRLLCGDSTSADDVSRLMAGERAVLMATDPPYLVDYRGGEHPATEANGGKRGEETSRHWDEYVDHEHSVAFYVAFLKTALECALAPDAAIYECYGIMRSEVIWQAWRECGLLAHQVLIWKKTRSVLTYSWFMWDYEPILVGWPQGHQPKRKPPADAKAVWEISSQIEDTPGSIHPTMKPVELIRRPITYHTKPGSLIYEPFSGSGTALIAAEETGRTCCAMELSPAFVDVAVQRWQSFSGAEAVLDGDDRTFAEMTAERCA